MDSAPTASASNPPPTRNQRGAIASQACETCRSRKQRCDEQRPKCSLCERMKLECLYREPQPTKKDKTLVEIMDRLKSLEGKIDRIPLRPSGLTGFGHSHSSPPDKLSSIADVDVDPTSYSSSMPRTSLPSDPSDSSKSQPHHYTFAAHKMLAWPAIQQLLLQAVPSSLADLKSVEQEGSAFIVRMQKNTPNLPLDEALPDSPFVGMQTQATRALGGARVTFLTLTRETMHHLATTYFDTFNLLYPFMDRQNFLSDTLIRVQTEGFNGDTDSVTALLVFALGELAIEGSRGAPIAGHQGRSSGVRGGSESTPPGLVYFNEARRRIGFVFTQCDLENVQIFSLVALYYECCSRHVDFWRMTVSASLACQTLITCNTIDWDSPRGDLTKRAYWHCVMMETGLHLELELPLTGIIDLEDSVGMPSFNSPFCEADDRGNQSSHFRAHYTSQVALRRLRNELHNNISNSMKNTGIDSTSSDAFGELAARSLKRFALQLTQWRGMLPRDLQWEEEDPASFPSPQSLPLSISRSIQAVDPELSPQERPPGLPLFSTDLDGEPVHYPYLYDIQVALLRTQYYSAKYMAYRPFVYKALHFPEQMTQEDAEGAAECLRSCLLWPLTLSPPSRRKRLVPYLFCWSQNFLGILLIIHLTRHNPMLRDIRTQLCGARFEAQVDESVELMVDWIRDLGSSDHMALWCWKIVQGIYNIE